MHHLFNVFVLNILLHVSAFQNTIIREQWRTQKFCSGGFRQEFFSGGSKNSAEDRG
jgi:hypothetical protein